MHETPRQPVQPARTPWVWIAVAAVAVAAIGVSTLHFVTAACAAARFPVPQPAASGQAAPPPVNTVTHGRAFFYNPGSGQGTCSFGPLPSNGLYVSLGAPQYAAGAACGSWLDISGPAGTVRAQVVDDCPGCTNGGIDMSAAAFSRVANLSAGTALVSYRLARDPRLPGPLELRVGQAAWTSWLALQVINQGNPLASVDVRTAGRFRWQPLALSPDDYWVAPSGAGPGPFQVQVTDIFGHRVVLSGIRLAPGSLQLTRVLMYTPGTQSQQQSAATPPRPSSSSSPAASESATPRAIGSAAAHAASRSHSGTGPGC